MQTSSPATSGQPPKPFVIGGNLRGASITVWTHPSEQHRSKTSLEFAEGKRAYADGIDGYAATPYDDSTQQMTDWFAGWIAARNADQMQAAQQVAA